MSRAKLKGKSINLLSSWAHVSHSSLTKIYKKHAKRLQLTGEGVQGSEGDSQGGGETLSFYISGEGPCVETPLHAINIWSTWTFFAYSSIHLIHYQRKLRRSFLSSLPSIISSPLVQMSLQLSSPPLLAHRVPRQSGTSHPTTTATLTPSCSIWAFMQLYKHLSESSHLVMMYHVSGLVNADPNRAPHTVNVGDTVNVMKPDIPAKTPGPQCSPKVSSASQGCTLPSLG